MMSHALQISMAIGQGPGSSASLARQLLIIAHMGLLGYSAPLRGILGDLSVEVYPLGVKGGHQLKHSPEEPLEDCSHPQSKVAAAATLW